MVLICTCVCLVYAWCMHSVSVKAGYVDAQSCLDISMLKSCLDTSMLKSCLDMLMLRVVWIC